jgi:transcriptional regulator with XRE-family HTH domain
MNLGDTARHLREFFGITQRAAADRLGISYVHLCNLENNKSRPSPEMLERFRDVFGVDLYVYSWCNSADIERIPAGMKNATRQMTEVWQRVIEQKRQEFLSQG